MFWKRSLAKQRRCAGSIAHNNDDSVPNEREEKESSVHGCEGKDRILSQPYVAAAAAATVVAAPRDGCGQRGKLSSATDDDDSEAQAAATAAERWHITQKTSKYMERWTEESDFIERNPPPALPVFQAQDVEISSDPLGEGEFGIVFAVTALHFAGKRNQQNYQLEEERQQQTLNHTPDEEEDHVRPSEDTIFSSLASAPLNRWCRQDSCNALASIKGPSPDDGNFTLRIPSIRMAQLRTSSSRSNLMHMAAEEGSDALSVATHRTATASIAANEHRQNPPGSLSSGRRRYDSGTVKSATKSKPYKGLSSSLSKKSLKQQKHASSSYLQTHNKDSELGGHLFHQMTSSNTITLDDGMTGTNCDQDRIHDDNSTLSTTGDDALLDDDDWFIRDDDVQLQQNSDDVHHDGEADILRDYMTQHVLRLGQPRYAVKRLHNKKGGHYTFTNAVDLACEARFLASLRHPNVIRLRATIGTPGESDFGLIMDRSEMTLRDKLRQWRDEELLHRKRRKWRNVRKDLLADKLLAVYDVARAMRYLHNQMIVFRDLKPENVAVDFHGEMRLFDFGLAKELRARDLAQAPDDFHATGLTGSRRYMSPEVALCHTYGLKSDVYSFAIFMWEVLASHHRRQPSTLAFPRMHIDDHYERVVVGGERPPLRRRVRPESLRPLLERSWSAVPSRRPSFRALCEQLREAVSSFAGNAGGDGGGGGGIVVTDRTAYLSGLSIKSRNE